LLSYNHVHQPHGLIITEGAKSFGQLLLNATRSMWNPSIQTGTSPHSVAVVRVAAVSTVHTASASSLQAWPASKRTSKLHHCSGHLVAHGSVALVVVNGGSGSRMTGGPRCGSRGSRGTASTTGADGSLGSQKAGPQARSGSGVGSVGSSAGHCDSWEV